MDANGLRFWMLAGEDHWHRPGDPPALAYLAGQGLRLAGARADAGLVEDRAAAPLRLARVPATRDSFANRAYWDPAAASVMASGAGAGAVALYAPASAPSDLLLGHDGVLYLAVDGAVVLWDLRRRWPPITVTAPGFRAWRLAAHGDGGVWALDRDSGALARLHGLPLRERPLAEYNPDVFRPCEENPEPPRLHVQPAPPWAAGDTPVALTAGPGGLLVLCWRGDAPARVYRLDADGALLAGHDLPGAARPYSLAWLEGGRIAVLLAGVAEALVYTPGDTGQAAASGDFYPLPGHDGGPFLHVLAGPPHYPMTGGSRGLHRLSLPTYRRHGEARNWRADGGLHPLDGASPGLAWHRMYLEAVVPARCGLRVWLAASDAPQPPAEADWFEHRVGDPEAPPSAPGVPRAVWVDADAEVPFHPGLLHCPREPDRAGLFTVLIQRAGRRVRTLRGRYLWVRVALSGDGRSTPTLAALRVHGGRFSYIEQYLPALYREDSFGPDADAESPRSTPADFLERLVDNLEGILTPLEDRIGHAHLLTDPRSAPDEALAWLGSWIGLGFEPGTPSARQRRMLQAAPELYRRHGTLEGLKLALDLASDGAVQGGEIVVLEDFRLRRSFATILGADLADTEDPLLGGLAVSGNAFVGDTLFLGDEQRREFLALFAGDLDEADAAAVAALFDDLAHRVTVLVHEHLAPQDLALLRRVTALAAPAHVQARVRAASAPLRVAVAALVGVDSYLGETPPPAPVRVARSRIGRRDFLQDPAALDPRQYGGAGTPRPLAVAEDVASEWGESFVLDGSASRAAAGLRLVDYQWRLLPPD